MSGNDDDPGKVAFVHHETITRSLFVLNFAHYENQVDDDDMLQHVAFYLSLDVCCYLLSLWPPLFLGKFVRRIQGTNGDIFNSLVGVCALQDGTIVVCDTQNHRLQLRQPDGTVIRMIGSVGAQPNQFNVPFAVACLPDGETLVVCDRQNNRLVVVKVDGTFQGTIDNGSGSGPNQFRDPMGICILLDGTTALVVDFANSRIQVVDVMTGKFHRQIGGSAPNQFCAPIGICLLPGGRTAAVCDRGNHRVVIVQVEDGAFITSIGNKAGPLLNQFHYPTGVCAVRMRTPTSTTEIVLLITDYSNNRIQVVTLDGHFLKQIGGPGNGPVQFKFPSGICAAGSFVVVSDVANSRIHILE